MKITEIVNQLWNNHREELTRASSLMIRDNLIFGRVYDTSYYLMLVRFQMYYHEHGNGD
jgi:hypothetical protein